MFTIVGFRVLWPVSRCGMDAVVMLALMWRLKLSNEPFYASSELLHYLGKTVGAKGSCSRCGNERQVSSCSTHCLIAHRSRSALHEAVTEAEKGEKIKLDHKNTEKYRKMSNNSYRILHRNYYHSASLST